MQNYVFYIKVDSDNDEVMDKTADLLEALHQNYGVIYEAVVRVETDKEFLVPIIKQLQIDGEAANELTPAVTEPIDTDKRAVIETNSGKICPQCGKSFTGKKKFCSTVCYNQDWRARNPSKKSNKKGQVDLPNQGAFENKRAEEQARIDAVVANAKDTAPGATFQRVPTGPIMARKL